MYGKCRLINYEENWWWLGCSGAYVIFFQAFRDRVLQLTSLANAAVLMVQFYTCVKMNGCYCFQFQVGMRCMFACLCFCHYNLYYCYCHILVVLLLSIFVPCFVSLHTYYYNLYYCYCHIYQLWFPQIDQFCRISLFTCTLQHLCTSVVVVVWQTPEANHICHAVFVTWHFYMACLYYYTLWCSIHLLLVEHDPWFDIKVELFIASLMLQH